MRNIPYIILFVALAFSTLTYAAEAKRNGKNFMTDKRDVQDFSKIVFTGKGNLYIQQGDHEVVQIVANERLIPYIKTEVIDSTLSIGEKSLSWFLSLKKFEPYSVYITVKKIEEITLAGNGTISIEKKIKEEKLSLTVNGSGKVNGALDVEFLTALITGSAEFNLRGSATNQNIVIAGAGIYDSLKVLGKTAKVNIMGSSIVRLNVQELLDISISGNGKVTYMGSPKVIQKIVGSGKIEELK